MKVLNYLGIALSVMIVAAPVIKADYNQEETSDEERGSSARHRHKRHQKRKQLPAGNYKQSCRNCSVEDDVLKCECLDNTLPFIGDHNYVETELELDPHAGAIINRYGELTYNKNNVLGFLDYL